MDLVQRIQGITGLMMRFKKLSMFLSLLLYAVTSFYIQKLKKWLMNQSNIASSSLKPYIYTDVLVAGYGCAGGVAAIQAVESLKTVSPSTTTAALGEELKPNATPRVLLIDRFEGGGATSRSGGIIYFGGGTDVQKKLGVNDSVQNMFEYLKIETRGAVSDETLLRYCATSPECASWLRDTCGLTVNVPDESAVLCPFKTSNAPDHYSVFYSGSETCYPYTTVASPAPRGHKVVGPGNLVGTGNVLFEQLDAKVRKLEQDNAIQVATYTKLDQLLFEDENKKDKVIGARILSMNEAPFWARIFYKAVSRYGGLTNPFPFLDGIVIGIQNAFEDVYGETQDVFTSKGVIISAGGFCRNQELIAKNCPKFSNLMPIGSSGDDGNAIFELGIKQAGGRGKDLDCASCWKFIVPPQSFPKGILVSLEGKRMINEDVYGARLGEEIIVNHNGKGWLIIDEKIALEAMDELYNGEMLYFQMAFTLLNLKWNCQKANTLEELAQKCGIQLETFMQTVKEYNAGSAKGIDPLFYKHPTKLGVLENGPFYAINMNAHGTMFVSPSFTIGGVEVDERSGQVISDKTNQPIQGLYAAGRTAAGICSKSYVSGLSLGDCVFSGRRAAMHAITGEIFGDTISIQVNDNLNKPLLTPVAVNAKGKL